MVEEDGNGMASNAIWAIALIIIVGMIAGVVYYSGMLRTTNPDRKVDINVTAPAAPPAAPVR